MHHRVRCGPSGRRRMLGAPARSPSPCQVYPRTTRGAPAVHEGRSHAGRWPGTRHHADPVAIARHGRRGRAGSCVLSAWWFGTASSSCRGLSGPGLCGGRSTACAMPELVHWEPGRHRVAEPGAQAAERPGVEPPARALRLDVLAREGDEVAAVPDDHRVVVEDLGQLAADAGRELACALATASRPRTRTSPAR